RESLPDDQDRERAGDDRAAVGAAGGGGLAGGRGGAVGGDQEDLVGLAVQRAGLGAGAGLHGLLHREIGRAVFLDDRERAVALRAEGFHRRGVEQGAVGAGADRQGGDDLS